MERIPNHLFDVPADVFETGIDVAVFKWIIFFFKIEISPMPTSMQVPRL